MDLQNENIKLKVNNFHLLLFGICLLFGIIKMYFCYFNSILVDNVWRF